MFAMVTEKVRNYFAGCRHFCRNGLRNLYRNVLVYAMTSYALHGTNINLVGENLKEFTKLPKTVKNVRINRKKLSVLNNRLRRTADKIGTR